MSRGFVATPDALVDRMVSALKPGAAAKAGARVLEPGCGACTFLTRFVTHYARRAKRERLGPSWVASRLRGVEIDSARGAQARLRVQEAAKAEGILLKEHHLDRIVVEDDFLQFEEDSWDLIVGNPPYVRLEGIGLKERADYRGRFETARQRYDLYFLFFEHAIRLLAPAGRLSFVTPQKYLRVWSGQPLRRLLTTRRLNALEFLPEGAFNGHVTYPLITRLKNVAPPQSHRVLIRDENGQTRRVPQIRFSEEPWTAAFVQAATPAAGCSLRDLADSIGVGVATGADAAYCLAPEEEALLPTMLTRRTVSGRHLPDSPEKPILTWETLLWPYDDDGRPIGPTELAETAPKALAFLRLKRPVLQRRTCASRPGRDWYEFHERPRVRDYSRTKIMVPDIQLDPVFRVDREGYIPRHSVYYIVPRPGVDVDRLCAYLNSETARAWLKGHCQPAAGGRIRVQSKVLGRLPVPDALVKKGVMSHAS